MAIEVRPLTARDWPSVVPLLRGMGLVEGSDAEVRQRFETLLADDRWTLLGAFHSRSLIGYAAAQDHGPHLRTGDAHRTARLHDLYVTPPARQCGVGTALLATVVSWASKRVKHLEWQAHHEHAAPFYERLGYRGVPCPQPDHPTFEITF